MKQSHYTVGISGASGSGKTSFLNELLQYFSPEQICLVSLDNYYRPAQFQTEDKNGIINFDVPQALDLDLYFEDVQKLWQGLTVLRPEYTFNNPERKAREIVMRPAPLLLVEGLYVFHEERLRQMLDLKVFIDVEDHIRLKRRILRDKEERGYDLDDVLYRYEYHVFPAYQQYIAPHRYTCDLVIPNNHHFEKGLAVLVAFCKCN
ncbi:MAG: uridine kinase [Microscillaceae bacterium]|nr:uridine kinase [Microscillaceae bacterium]